MFQTKLEIDVHRVFELLLVAVVLVRCTPFSLFLSLSLSPSCVLFTAVCCLARTQYEYHERGKGAPSYHARGPVGHYWWILVLATCKASGTTCVRVSALQQVCMSTACKFYITGLFMNVVIQFGSGNWKQTGPLH